MFGASMKERCLDVVLGLVERVKSCLDHGDVLGARSTWSSAAEGGLLHSLVLSVVGVDLVFSRVPLIGLVVVLFISLRLLRKNFVEKVKSVSELLNGSARFGTMADRCVPF